MPSAIIHLAVASEIGKKIKKDNNRFLIGAIAPDIWKWVGDEKMKSHFQTNEIDNIPSLDLFLSKYKKYLNDDFVLGYYIHLYTDYIWFKYFIPEIFNDDEKIITKLDGTPVKCNGEMLSLYIYNDYTNLNIKLIEKYNLNLKIFYRDPPTLKNIIEEIPMTKIKIIINAVKEIIENTKEHKDLVFNMDNISQFINTAIELIISNLEELKILENGVNNG